MTDLSDVIRLASSFNINGYKNATTDKQRNHFINAMKLVKGSTISVFTTGGSITPIRIAAAFVAREDKPRGISYIMLSGKFACLIIDGGGGTLDSGVNSMHSDIISLSDDQVVDILESIENEKFESFSEDEIKAEIRRGITAGNIDASRMSFTV